MAPLMGELVTQVSQAPEKRRLAKASRPPMPAPAVTAMMLSHIAMTPKLSQPTDLRHPNVRLRDPLLSPLGFSAAD